MFTSPEARRRTAGWLLALAVVVLGSATLVGRHLPWLTDPVSLRAVFESAGPYAPAAFVVMQAAQVVVAPIPGQAIGFTWCSSCRDATAAGTSSARFSAGRAVRRARPAARPARAVHRVPRSGLPDDVVCFVAGFTDLRIRDMLVVSAAGRLPGYFVVNAAGAQFEAGDVTTAVLLVGALVALSALGYVWRDGLLGRLAGASE